jgi:dihydrofolate synthase / folylpolyglutamate synthase
MRYAEVLGRLYAARRAGVRFELGRVRAALARLGHPERRAAVRVHIGGTNGKGSTAAFVEALCRRGGLRTGLYTSPHLSRLCERFVVDGAPVGEEAVAAAAEAVLAVAGELTFFEQVTALALALFAEAGVEVAVLEVGLGGRLDATNAVDCEVAAVTGVALDHQAYLGAELAAIAAEKAGIFKAGQRAVIGAAGEPAAATQLVAAARRAEVAALAVIDDAAVAALDGWPVGLAGPHQRANAACALAVADHLTALGHLRLAGDERRAALAETRLPGRLETLADAPRVIADGAHNPHAAAALARALAPMPRRRLILVVGVAADKDVAGVLAPLAALADGIIATRAGGERAMPPVELAQLARRLAPGREVATAPDVATALDGARAAARADDLIVCAGSLFVVGAAREAVLGVTPDPLPVSDPMGGNLRGDGQVRTIPP